MNNGKCQHLRTTHFGRDGWCCEDCGESGTGKSIEQQFADTVPAMPVLIALGVVMMVLALIAMGLFMSQ